MSDNLTRLFKAYMATKLGKIVGPPEHASSCAIVVCPCRLLDMTISCRAICSVSCL